jgi:hypothetical protein
MCGRDDVQAMTAGQQMEQEAQRSLASQIAGDKSSVDKELLKPLLEPFLSGVIKEVGKGAWKGDAAVGMLTALVGKCFSGSAKADATKP